MKVHVVVGTRPQLIKLASIAKAFDRIGLDYGVVHMGQHYDFDMNETFFEELGLPIPTVNLGVGSGSHGWQTGTMLKRFDSYLQQNRSEVVVVPGDTNSALAGGLAAIKLKIKVAHVEAGLRSHEEFMPEEINRVILDHISQVLFPPTTTAKKNLAKEGLKGSRVRLSGDVMADNVLIFSKRLRHVELPIKVEPKKYVYVTVHRSENVDKPENLSKVAKIISKIPAKHDVDVVFPVHPHTSKKLESGIHLDWAPRIHLLKPVSYLQSLRLTRDAAVVVTDSGGLQKEAFMLKTPAVTLRRTTEWIETVDAGWNVLAELDEGKVSDALGKFLSSRPRQVNTLRLYGNGHAAYRIAAVLKQLLR